MALKKNPTPNQVAFFLASIQSIFAFLTLVVLQSIFNLSFGWWLLLGPLLILGFNYIVTISALRQFIYRKIKTIYKSIQTIKQAKGVVYNKIQVDEDIIANVEEEVTEWAEEKDNQIAHLKNMEEYRKEYIGNVSHELKTPIFSIQGYIQTLLDGGLEDPNVNYRFLEKADKNVERLIRIVEDLEIINQLESGKMSFNMEEFDIVSLAKECIALMDDDAGKLKKKIDIRIKDGFRPSIKVAGDRDRIQQVFINLISNSIKYGKDDGYTQVGFYDMDNLILVEVSDNGIGIKEEQLPRVFERFFRVDKSRSRDAGGTGLGLSIVKHIVEAHGQALNLRSKENMGSTFGFTLQKAGEKSNGKGHTPPMEGVSILQGK